MKFYLIASLLGLSLLSHAQQQDTLFLKNGKRGIGSINAVGRTYISMTQPYAKGTHKVFYYRDSVADMSIGGIHQSPGKDGAYLTSDTLFLKDGRQVVGDITFQNEQNVFMDVAVGRKVRKAIISKDVIARTAFVEESKVMIDYIPSAKNRNGLFVSIPGTPVYNSGNLKVKEGSFMEVGYHGEVLFTRNNKFAFVAEPGFSIFQYTQRLYGGQRRGTYLQNANELTIQVPIGFQYISRERTGLAVFIGMTPGLSRTPFIAPRISIGGVIPLGPDHSIRLELLAQGRVVKEEDLLAGRYILAMLALKTTFIFGD